VYLGPFLSRRDKVVTAFSRVETFRRGSTYRGKSAKKLVLFD